MKSKKLLPKRACIHEAGHSVLAEVLGFRVVTVTVRRASGVTGFCSRRKIVDPLRLAIATIGGHAAEVVLLGKNKTTTGGAAEDMREISSLGYYGTSCATILAIASGLVQLYSDAIIHVADELSKRNLCGESIRRIIKEVGRTKPT